MSEEYSFLKDLLIDTSSNINDERENFRVIRCCGNCAFYWYPRHSGRRGHCRYLTEYNRGGKGYKRVSESVKKSWPKTHVTCMCDHHDFTHHKRTLGKILEWVGQDQYVETDK